MSIVVWAPTDSALCLYYGLYPAVALNVAVASLFIGLLFSVRHQAINHQTTPHACPPAQS
jgi:hypothetical protein